VTDIVLDFNQQSTLTAGRNIRVGGIAGSCQQSIYSCYAGGSITYTDRAVTAMNATSSKSNKLVSYASGIIGGVFMRGLNYGSGSVSNNTSSSITLQSCYSYVTLPRQTTSHITRICPIGSVADFGSSKVEVNNCYYLTETATANSAPLYSDGGIARTYDQMASAGFQDELNKVTASGVRTYTTVTTTTATGEAISGKYSLAANSALLGLDYPFPTILTQDNDGETVNLHYGDWPVSGIGRDTGALPIECDLFRDYDEAKGGAVWQETIRLSAIAQTGGHFTVVPAESYEEGGPVDQVAIDDKTAQLTFVAKRAGDTQLTVTYTVGNVTYPALTIDVYVTADLELLPQTETVFLFPDETAQVPLALRTGDRKALPAALASQITLTGSTPHLEDKYLAGAAVTGDGSDLTLDSQSETGETQLTLDFTFTYLGQTYSGSSSIAVSILRSTVALEPVHIYLNGAESQELLYTADKVDIQVAGSEEKPSEVAIIGLVDSGDKDLVHATWTDSAHSSVTIRGHDEEGAEDESVAYPQLQIQFRYGGCTHTLWEYLPVYVHRGADPELVASDQTAEGGETP
jgi:hypothetical protein